MNRIKRLFPELPAAGLAQIETFLSLLLEKNRMINLISRRREEQVIEDHLLPSLAIAKFCNFAPGTRLVDVGTGGGFPGIPLAILLPHCRFHLIDSIGKKVRCVQGFIDQLGLKNATAQQIRAEQLKETFDFVLGRAVSPLADFHGHTRHLLRRGHRSSRPNGILYLKGGDVSEDRRHFRGLVQVSLSDLLGAPMGGEKCLLHLPFHHT